MFNGKGAEMKKAYSSFLTPALDSFVILTKLHISLCCNIPITKILMIILKPRFIETFKRNKYGGILSRHL